MSRWSTKRFGRFAVAAFAAAAIAALPASAPALADDVGARAAKAPARPAPMLTAWAQDSPNKKKLIAYVRKVTRKGSSSYIPVKDRIAVFDQDGTLSVEGDTEALIPEVAVALHRADELVKNGSVHAGDPLYDNYQKLKEQLATDPTLENAGSDTLYEVMGEAFNGMRADRYVKYVTQYMSSSTQPDIHVKWTDGFYRPMVELVSYLEANKFTVYVVSASQRQFVWGFAGPVLGLPRSQMIGTDVDLALSPKSDVLRKDKFLTYNYDEQKVFNIYRQIGKKPVLAFGNSGSDYDMMNFTMSSRHPAMAFLVVHDDAKREYEYDVDSRLEAAKENGWQAISMAHEFTNLWEGKPARPKAKAAG